MDARLPHSKAVKKRKKRRVVDRHGWNSLEDYILIYQKHLDEHPFIDHSKPLPEFEYYHSEEDKTVIAFLNGYIYCLNQVVLEIRKIFETKYLSNGVFKIRCKSYCYEASLKGERELIRYDNLDSFEDYHKHLFDENGKQLGRKSLSRNEFPLLHEVIDELQNLFSPQ